MKNRKNGFTLIEMLVCIAIIAALGVIVGLSANTILSNARKSDYQEIMTNVFDAAKIYVELSTTTCNLDSGTECNVTIADLINKGLLDKNFLEKNNPMYVNRKFNSVDEVRVFKYLGIKDAEIVCITNSSYKLKASKVEDYNFWGEC